MLALRALEGSSRKEGREGMRDEVLLENEQVRRVRRQRHPGTVEFREKI